MTELTPEQIRAAAIKTVYATATLGGKAHDPIAIAIDREIATQMPEGIAGGGGMVKATGSLELNDPVTPATSIITRRTSPWLPVAGWPPARGQAANIDLHVDDDPTQRRFTGRVAKISGSVKDTTTVDIEDRTDDLKIDFSHDAMLRTMPPPGDNTDTMIQVGLRADWIADKIFRRAGFYTTPPTMGTVLMSVPAQGSMWPSRGTCRTCDDLSSGDGLPDWVTAPWGWAVSDVKATYRLAGSTTTLRGRAIAQGMVVSPTSSAYARVDTTLGSATLTLFVNANRQVQVRVNNSTISGAAVTPDAGWTRVEAIWSSGGGVRIHTDTGWSRQIAWTPGSAVLDGAYSQSTIEVNTGAAAAGFVVQFVGNSYTGGYTAVPQSATIVPGTLLGHMRAMPSLTSRDGLNLLQEISESLAISLWIDEDGHLWWVHPDRMRDQAPVATLTADADLLDLVWEDTANLARRSVTVTYSEPTIRRKLQYRLKAWEGSGDNLKQGESTEEIIAPAADQDWIEVSGLGAAIYATPFPSNPQELPDFNRGIGSWVGGTHLDANGDSPQTKLADWEDGSTTPGWIVNHNDDFPNLQRSFTRIGPAAWKLSVGLQDLASNYWPEIQQKLDPVKDHEGAVAGVGSDINMSWTGQNMPIIRCKAITDWADAEYTSSITGPSVYEEFVHDTGPWAGDSVKTLGDWLAEQVTNPSPLVRDFPVAYRSDIRLGNVVTIVEDVVYKVRLRVLIIGLSEKHSEGDSELALTGRVISATALAWTYDQMQAWAAAQGMDYDDLEARDGTYAELSLPPENLTAVLAAREQLEEFAGRPVPDVQPAPMDPRAITSDPGVGEEEVSVADGRWRWPAPSEIPPVDVHPGITTPDIDVTPPDDGGTEA